MTRSRGLTLVTTAALLISLGVAVYAQNDAPIAYRTAEGVWGQLPEGRAWGATSAVYPAGDGSGDIWVGERCGANSCANRPDLDPILRFTSDGELRYSFGAGMILWPHGMFVDVDRNVWITDAVGFGRNPRPEMGHVVLKFSPRGELLMTLGQPGVAGDGADTFQQPSDVLVAPNGNIFVVDGHGVAGNNRVVKFASDGTFIMEWGQTGSENGEFRDPHALAMDSQGRLYVGDRGNSRVQIFTQNGDHLATWTQFGRPSGLFITAADVLYVADSESNARRNPGWKRGIRFGSVADGMVDGFIPDPEPDQDNSGTSAAEGVAVDASGDVYGAEVGPLMLRKHICIVWSCTLEGGGGARPNADDYDGAMKAIRGALGAVGDQMSAEDAPGLEASAATIVEGMAKARAYWQTRDRRALRYAIGSQRAAQGFHSAAAAGDFEAAGVAFGALRETCSPCHEQYRERDADGNWQIKHSTGSPQSESTISWSGPAPEDTSGDQGGQARTAREVTPEAYDGAMKALRGAVREVGDQISGQDASGLTASADAITSSMARVMIYWRSQRERVAYGIADTAMGAGRSLQAAAAAGDFDAAGVAFGALRETCTPCHEQYRERNADGNWQIKAGSQ